MFDLGWVKLCWSSTPIAVGSTVGILAEHFGCWSLSAARIVYLVDEKDSVSGITRFGFAYGTLNQHVECGEERFMVEWQHSDDSVSYDILAFSRPRLLLAKLGYPFARALQRRFARESMQAMSRHVQSASL
jgi:uncharacterized protein (UPF0548 family)